MESCKTCTKSTFYVCTGCTDTFYCSKKCRKRNPHCSNHTLRNIRQSLLANKASKHPQPCKKKGRKNTKENSQKRDEADCIENAMSILHVTENVASSVSISTEELCFECAPIPGKGIGIIATRDIGYGELILQEQPVLNDTLDESLESQFNKLSCTDQEKVMRLYNAHPGCKELEGIIKSNRFSTDEVNSGSVMCIEASRFNHSCLPNVLHRYSKPFERVFAIRDIKKGEELCTSYIQSDIMMKTTRERRKFLFIVWRFECMCELCDTNDKAWQQQIELYRGRYQAIDAEIENPFLNLKERMALVREIFEVMEKGKMICPPLISMHAGDGFQLAVACKDRRKAVKYAKLGYEASLIANGDYSLETQSLLKRIKNPFERLVQAET
jgi:hypothetical protein